MTRKKYRNATIKLIIGLILLGGSWWYLGQHPAEKASLVSGMEVLSHKVSVRIGSLTGKDTHTMEQQYKVIRYMDEMRYSAQHTSGCEQGPLIQEIDDEMNHVKNISLEQFASEASLYREKTRQRSAHIEQNCTTI